MYDPNADTMEAVMAIGFCISFLVCIILVAISTSRD